MEGVSFGPPRRCSPSEQRLFDSFVDISSHHNSQHTEHIKQFENAKSSESNAIQIQIVFTRHIIHSFNAIAIMSIKPKPNLLSRVVHRINTHSLIPQSWKPTALSLAFNSKIKYAGTTGIAIQKWNRDETVVKIKNRWRVQNHLGGVHATAMATLAESATGMLFGIYVPDTHLPLLKSMKVTFNKRAIGDLQAVSTITEEQKQQIMNTDRGSTIMQVVVTDEEGKEPIQCEMEWAWTSKKKKAAKPVETKTDGEAVVL